MTAGGGGGGGIPELEACCATRGICCNSEPSANPNGTLRGHNAHEAAIAVAERSQKIA